MRYLGRHFGFARMCYMGKRPIKTFQHSTQIYIAIVEKWNECCGDVYKGSSFFFLKFLFLFISLFICLFLYLFIDSFIRSTNLDLFFFFDVALVLVVAVTGLSTRGCHLAKPWLRFECSASIRRSLLVNNRNNRHPYATIYCGNVWRPKVEHSELSRYTLSKDELDPHKTWCHR